LIAQSGTVKIKRTEELGCSEIVLVLGFIIADFFLLLEELQLLRL
jgi:hypothetical protein